MNWVQIDAVYQAWTGNLVPLANELAEGKEVTEEAAEFLSMYLLGEIRWGRGNKRLYSQIVRDVDLENSIAFRHELGGVSFEQAIREYCEDAGTSYETVRSALKRAREFDGVLHPMATVRAATAYMSMM